MDPKQERRRDPRALQGAYQERRRADALARQREARADAAARARRLVQPDASPSSSEDAAAQEHAQQCDASASSREVAMGEPGPSGRQASPSGGRQAGHRRSGGGRQVYAGQLMQPEWMVDVPPRLGADWYVLPRPEGLRCLVIAAGGCTTARLRSGALLERFPSALPGGGPVHAGGGGRDGGSCILDCVRHGADGAYYVCDLMCWKGYALYDCTAEFRLFWLASKLAEALAEGGGTAPGGAAAGGGAAGGGGGRRFVPLPAYPATQGGLQAAHGGPVPFVRDGLYLLHRQGHYAPGQTPLALLWKDAACSLYFLETDPLGVPLAQQQLVLEYRMDATVATSDDPPVVLGRMPQAAVAALGPALRPGRLMRFRLGPGGVAFGADGQPVGADLQFDGPANQRRGRPDALSKILFQHAARHHPITLAELLAAAAASEGGASETTAAVVSPPAVEDMAG